MRVHCLRRWLILWKVSDLFSDHDLLTFFPRAMSVNNDPYRAATKSLRHLVCTWGYSVSFPAGMILLLGCWGCGRTTEPGSTDAAVPAAHEAASASDLRSPSDRLSQRSFTGRSSDAPSEPPSLLAHGQMTGEGSSAALSAKSPADQQALSEALFADDAKPSESTTPEDPDPVPIERLQLRGDLPPEQLIQFLRLVDAEMLNVTSGRKKLFNVADANSELIRLAKLKLQAADRLEQQAAAETQQMAIAIRGKLQALSHLASLGNLPAAQQLETLARQYVDSQDGTVALDSQLVLVGLAMERLQNGTSTDASEILGLIDRIASARQTPDVSALMVMGQARAVLQQYGDDEAAEQIRTRIVELFANHPNPNIGAMAIELAGSPKFAGINELLREIDQGQNVSVDKWKEAAEMLVNDSADMAAVQYLASAALQFEAYGHAELADATFDVLSQSGRFEDREAEQIEIAKQARASRAAIVGQEAQFDLPSVDGRPLSIDSYSGQVVLMPFWAIAFPDSLEVLQTLDRIRQQSAGRVEILGMNLDTQDAPANEFLQQSPVRFRSFQSVSPSGVGANQIAQRFGLVSLPFVVIIGPDAKVAAVNLTGQGLAEQVQQLLSP